VVALVRAEYPIDLYPSLTSSALATRIKNSPQIDRYTDSLRGFEIRARRVDALAAVSGAPPPISPTQSLTK